MTTEDDQEIWSNENGENSFDLMSENAVRLKITVTVPDREEAMASLGCVSVLVGTKE